MRPWRLGIGLFTAIVGIGVLIAPFGTESLEIGRSNRCSSPLTQVAAPPRPAPDPLDGRDSQPICREIGRSRVELAAVLIVVAIADLFGQSARARKLRLRPLHR